MRFFIVDTISPSVGRLREILQQTSSKAFSQPISVVHSTLILCEAIRSQTMKEQYQSLIEQYVQAYNAFDVEGMLAGLSEKVLFQNISNGQVGLQTEGIEAFKQQAEAAKNYFAERRQVISSWDFQGNQVRIGIDYTAILAMDFPNGMRAGEILQMSGHSTFEFEEGKIVSIVDES